MTVPIRLGEHAEADIKAAYGWYESQSTGLGETFLFALDEGLARIARHPRRHRRVYFDRRRLNLRRFPYMVIYTLEKNIAVVHAVLHAYRDPKVWKQRGR